MARTAEIKNSHNDQKWAEKKKPRKPRGEKKEKRQNARKPL